MHKMDKPNQVTIAPENLERAFEKMGYSGWGMQAALADKLGVTSQAISRWLSPTLDTQPTIDKLIKIANLANMSLDELILGENFARKEYFSVAVLDIPQAVAFVTNGKFIESNRIPVIGKIRNGFAIHNPDDSMNAIIGKNYPKNCLLVFDTNKPPEPEDCVFAILNNGDNQLTGIFRKYTKIGSQDYLIANNQSYPPISNHFIIKATLAYALIE
ncbi:MAG: helix-turn-helix domain-containing protein [Neisseriaceae bacterium]|nr:helix-turn-helix domain-containing protein [Neisseriaceae bacterium]